MATETLDTDSFPSRSNNMSKVERLNARVLKLLTAAVQEVLELVKETVTEFQEKTARTHRENERLRHRLQDTLEKLEKEKEVSRLAAISLSTNRSSSQPHQSSETQTVSCLPQDQTNIQTEAPAAQADAEPNAACETKVKIILSDVNAARAEQDASADSAEHQISEEKITVKTEPVPSQCFSELIPQTVPAIPDDQKPQAHFTTRLFTQTNHAVGNRWGSRSGRNQSRTDENHVCHVCGKSFSRVGNLRIHQRCHTGEKPYRCQVCGRCFSQTGDLKKHKRVHTGEKPYCCVQCGKRFSRGENLKRHQKVHARERLRRLSLWKDAHGLT